MRGKAALRAVSVVVLMMSVVGCVSQSQERMVLLEEANANLTGRLNLTTSELERVRQDQAYLDRRLVAAMNEARNLREQLDSQAQQPAIQAAAPGWTAVPCGAMITIDGSVLFSPGKATLLDDARRALDGVISAIQSQYADKDVLVLGHTDDQPIKKSGWADNVQLSSERALAVMRYLRDHGVASERLISGGCGEYRPRAEPTMAANRAANRRVEIFAIEPLVVGG